MQDKILMGHGSGGKLMNDLISGLIKEIFGIESLQLDDSAILTLPGNTLAFTTDTYTITPIFFRGGDIGSLAIHGTVNDLAVMGANPMFISCGLILEEGFKISKLEQILSSMKRAADFSGVKIVTGDTKVVEKGKADKVFINTSGIGIIENPVPRKEIEEGDMILINGSIGDHGMSILAERNGFSFSKELLSDSAPLNHLIIPLLKKFPQSIKFMRDATRGGIASVLNEVVQRQPYSVKLIEDNLPIKREVRGVSDILGIDPLYVANEGKVVIIVEKEMANTILNEMKNLNKGAESAIIGKITTDYPGKVFVETGIKGKRILSLLIEEQLPRIC
jgi:hydrogenase expression/formation protein HypE